MNSEPTGTETVEPNTDVEPAVLGYEDSLEGMLQYHADLSMFYARLVKTAKTNVKREFYKKKQIKNNNKLYRLLVRTPNQFNPLMKYLTPPEAEEAEEPHHETIGYSVPADENGEFPTPPEGVITTATGEP